MLDVRVIMKKSTHQQERTAQESGRNIRLPISLRTRSRNGRRHSDTKPEGQKKSRQAVGSGGFLLAFLAWCRCVAHYSKVRSIGGLVLRTSCVVPSC